MHPPSPGHLLLELQRLPFWRPKNYFQQPSLTLFSFVFRPAWFPSFLHAHLVDFSNSLVQRNWEWIKFIVLYPPWLDYSWVPMVCRVRLALHMKKWRFVPATPPAPRLLLLKACRWRKRRLGSHPTTAAGVCHLPLVAHYCILLSGTSSSWYQLLLYYFFVKSLGI